jgi:hypothetical protein
VEHLGDREARPGVAEFFAGDLFDRAAGGAER